MVSIQKMEEGKLDAQFLAAFIWQGKRDDVSSQKAVESTTLLIQSIYDEVAKYKDFCGIALTEKDLVRLKNEGKKAFFYRDREWLRHRQGPQEYKKIQTDGSQLYNSLPFLR